jgi:spermidine synthase
MRNDLIFDYLKSFNEVVKGKYTNGKDMLMIGGAAYQFPKYALSHYEDASIDVVEIDKKVLEIARKYFFLDDCVNTYDKEGKRHNFVIEDAKVYLINCDKKYDIVFNDAFAGKEPIRTLSTKETAQEVENILNPNGLYVLNVLGTYNESNRKYLYAQCNTLSQVFDYVYIRYASNEVEKNENDLVNYVVVASNHPLPMESLDFNYSDAIILTDNYCPIEILAY